MCPPAQFHTLANQYKERCRKGKKAAAMGVPKSEQLTSHNSGSTVASEKYKDISLDVLFALMADSYARETIVKERSSKEVEDFNKIHQQLAKDQNDLALLVGQIKTEAGKSILERLLKLDKDNARRVKASENKAKRK